MSAAQIIRNLVVRVDGDRYTISGQFEWEVIVAQDDAPDQAHREVDRMGQVLKREVYSVILEQADQQIVDQWLVANRGLQKRGRRPYPFVTRFGTVAVRRTRVRDSRENTWAVPSAVVWKTPQRKYIVPAVRQAAVDQMRQTSARKVRRQLSEEAHEDKLLGVSTIVKIVHAEGEQLIEAQRERALEVLKEHPETIARGLASWPEDEVLRKDADEEETALSADEQQEALERAVGFLNRTSQTGDATPGRSSDPSDESNGDVSSRSAAHVPRRVDAGWVLVQPDEVKTKAQASEPGKQNWTYTATVQVEEQTYYLAEASAAGLLRLIGSLLCILKVVEGTRRLMVIGDGAKWIRNWFHELNLPDREMILCWFHLADRLYQRLSAGGFAKARRESLEQEVLSHLWHGDLTRAIWVLWDIRSEARNPKWITDMIRYLLYRRAYLPNYSARHEAGLWIASNRVEKWNDWAVSNRCKRRGMSWTSDGVLSLATHEAAERNDELLSWRAKHELAQSA